MVAAQQRQAERAVRSGVLGIEPGRLAQGSDGSRQFSRLQQVYALPAKAIRCAGLPLRRSPSRALRFEESNGGPVHSLPEIFRRLAHLAYLGQGTEVQPIGPDTASRIGRRCHGASPAAALLKLAPAAARAGIVAARP